MELNKLSWQLHRVPPSCVTSMSQSLVKSPNTMAIEWLLSAKHSAPGASWGGSIAPWKSALEIQSQAVVAHTFNPSTFPEAGRFLNLRPAWSTESQDSHRETLSQKTRKEKKRERESFLLPILNIPLEAALPAFSLHCKVANYKESLGQTGE